MICKCHSFPSILSVNYTFLGGILPAVAFRQYDPVNMNGNTATSRKVIEEKCARDNPER